MKELLYLSLSLSFCLSLFPSPPLYSCSFEWHFIIYLPNNFYSQLVPGPLETCERNPAFPTYSSLGQAILTPVSSAFIHAVSSALLPSVLSSLLNLYFLIQIIACFSRSN